MPGLKTNERPGTRAVLRHCRMSAYKARQVLDLIRGEDVDRAAEILDLSDREAAGVIGKVLASAVANAEHNDGLDPEELYVVGLLRRRGHHAQALAPPGPRPGHPDPQAHLPHHGDREPAARRASSPAAGPASRRRAAAALAPRWPAPGAAPARRAGRLPPSTADDEPLDTDAEELATRHRGRRDGQIEDDRRRRRRGGRRRDRRAGAATEDEAADARLRTATEDDAASDAHRRR